jgi:uncharacterized small protein (DUF1192 family)
MIENRTEARGVRLAKDEMVDILSTGAMVLNGVLINILKERIARLEAKLAKVPGDWALSNGELAALDEQIGGNPCV